MIAREENYDWRAGRILTVIVGRPGALLRSILSVLVVEFAVLSVFGGFLFDSSSLEKGTYIMCVCIMRRG